MTIHDLLTHTAGLTYPWMEYGPVEELYRRHVSHLSDQPLADLVQQLTAMPLAFQPGSRFRYGLCHDVVARLIEVISGCRSTGSCRNASSAPWGWWTPGSSCHPRSSTVSPP